MLSALPGSWPARLWCSVQPHHGSKKRGATLWVFFSKKPERCFYFISSWFPTLALLSRFVEEGRAVFGWSVQFTFPWMPRPCGIKSRCWHCSWRLRQQKCRTMGLVKMQLQSSGEKAAETCSLHGMGHTPKPLARIPVPQAFKLWPRAKEGPVTRDWEEEQCNSLHVPGKRRWSRPPAARLEDTKMRNLWQRFPSPCCHSQKNNLSSPSWLCLGCNGPWLLPPPLLPSFFAACWDLHFHHKGPQQY